MFALTLLAGYALIGMLAGIDYASVWEELQDADWGWILVALVAATSTLGSREMSQSSCRPRQTYSAPNAP